MRIFKFEVDINKDKKTTEVHMNFNEEDFDPEAVDILKRLSESMAHMITVAYLKKEVNFEKISTEEGRKVDA